MACGQAYSHARHRQPAPPPQRSRDRHRLLLLRAKGEGDEKGTGVRLSRTELGFCSRIGNIPSATWQDKTAFASADSGWSAYG
jgi:hypothetical protein